jgi:hypothetical protein
MSGAQKMKVFNDGKWENQKTTGQPISKVSMLGPKEAAILMKGNTRNRTLNKSKVVGLRTDMLLGDWLPSSSIGFFEDGTLADGQTRLTALIEAGQIDPDIKIAVPILFGIQPKAAAVIDSGQIRNRRHLAQIYYFGDLAKGSLEMPAFYLQMRGVRPKTSAIQGIYLFEKTRDTVEFILNAYDKHSAGKKMIPGIDTSFITSAFYAARLSGEVTDEQIDSFIRVLVTSVPKNDQEAIIIKFRDQIISRPKASVGGASRPEFFLRAQKALKNFINNDAKAYTKTNKIVYNVPDILLPTIIQLPKPETT